jgi:hypothetical protein
MAQDRTANPPAAGTRETPRRRSLPRTASNLVTLELLSMAALAGALALRGLRKRLA